MSFPRVSVVLCTFNGERYIAEQLDSLLSSTLPIFEIIIQDDCSFDNTWQIINEYKEYYPQLIKCYKNTSNLFWNQNFYSAILKASGEYIALCDQDDIWLPNKLEVQVSDLLRTNQLVHICDQWEWNDYGLFPVHYKKTSFFSAFFYPPYCGHTMLLKKDVQNYIHTGMSIDLAHDMFLGLLAAYQDSISYSDARLVKWRRHSNAATKQEEAMDSISGKAKIAYSIKQLIKGNKSSVIRIGVNKYYQTLLFFEQSFGKRADTKHALTFLSCLKKQTLFSYFHAAILFCFIDDTVVDSSLTWLKRLYAKLTYVFKWWFDHQYNL